MKWNVADAGKIFKGAILNKNKAKIFVVIIVFFIVVAFGIILWAYSLTQRTISVCVSSVPIIKNQMISFDNIREYKMTLKEFERYAIQQTNTGYTNRIVEWYGTNPKTGKREAGYGAAPIIGMYSGYSLMAGEFIMWPKLVGTPTDNSRMILYSYPGKEIAELDISNSNLDTFKNILQVGDKVNISCSYSTEYQLNLSLEGMKKSSGDATQEVSTTVVNDLFTGVVIADILNTEKESLLDYRLYLEGLPTAQKIAIENSDEHKKKMRVAHLMLALTPDELREYRLYKAKENIKFDVSLPQVD